MSVTIKRYTNLKTIADKLNSARDRILKASQNVMLRVGEECVTAARNNGDYNDITGNLRSSIGYSVITQGHVTRIGKGVTFSGTEGRGKDGPEAAKRLLGELQSEVPAGCVGLVVVAGMEYAIYVEELHGRDVLTSAELLAKERIPYYMVKLKLADK